MNINKIFTVAIGIVQFGIYWLSLIYLYKFFKMLWIYKSEILIFQLSKFLILIILIVGTIYISVNYKRSIVIKNRLEEINNSGCCYEINGFKFNLTTDEFERNFPKEQWDMHSKKVLFGKEYLSKGSFPFYEYNTKNINLIFEQGVLNEINFTFDVNNQDDFYYLSKEYGEINTISSFSSSNQYFVNENIIYKINDCTSMGIEFVEYIKESKKFIRIRFKGIFQNHYLN
ncbi:hypothetical protein [Maribellus maritimus]|uniref:hypothetical protein n=1 Tax=Maribellus maritimus TaxID=2870838 RepID=UPI001EECEE93|nr:hypothetical protein [Maribellus maritimus]MCG6190127.1 hypothetical protein [Maribellus maritimus]